MKITLNSTRLRKHSPLEFLLWLSLLIICDNLIAQNVSGGYDYPVKPGSDKWSTLNSETQRIEALQIPEQTLLNMTDEAYVQTLLNFPLYGYFTAFDNNKVGFDVMATRFNVFDKMCIKKKAGSILLEAYKDADMSGFKKHKNIYKSDLWTIKLNYLEILLSQKDIISSLNENEKISLLQVALDKYNSKKNNIDFSSFYGVSPTLSLLANYLDNLNGLENVSSGRKMKIHEFLSTSRIEDTETITDIVESTELYLKNK